MPGFNLTAHVNLALSRGAISTLESQLRGGMSQLNVPVNVKVQGNSALSQTAGLLGDVRRQSLAAGGGLSSFARQAAAAGVGVGGLGTALGGVVGLLRRAASDVVDFDLSLNKLRQVTNQGAAGVRAVRGEIARLSTSLGVASKDLGDAALVFAQAGLKASDAAVAMRTFALAMNAPNFEGAKQTVEGMVAVYQQFGRDVTKLKDQMGAMNAVAGAFAVEAGDLVMAVQKTGGAFSSAGGQLNELLALMTAVRGTTRESAEQIATGLRSIFTYVQRSETVESLKDLGIHLRHTRQEAEALGDAGLADQFVGPYQAVQRLSEGLAKLRSTDPRYSQVVEDLGGVRQVGRVIPLVQQFAEAQKALNVARVGGVSLEIASEQRQDALATKLTKTTEKWKEFTHSLAESRGIQSMADALTRGADAAVSLLDALKPLVPVVVALSAAKLGSWLGTTAFGLAASRRAPSKFATGGPVTGGIPGQDSVMAALMPGEFVLRKDAVAKLGPERVAHMNRTGLLPGFARGGAVAHRKKRGHDLAGESARNIKLAEEALADVGVPGIDLSRLVSRLHFVKPSVLGRLVGGSYNPSSKVALVRAGMRLPTVAHETLGHAASNRAAEFANSQNSRASFIPGSVFQNVAIESLRSLIPKVMPLSTWERYSKQYLHQDDRMVDEGLAWGVQAFVHDLSAKAGRGPLPDDLRRAYDTAEIRRLFKAIRRDLLPEIRSFTASDLPPALPDYDDDLVKLDRRARGKTVRQRKLAAGGPITGGIPGQDSVLAALTPGEYVLRKQAVDRIGPDRVAHMNRTGLIPGFAGGGLVERRRRDEFSDPLALKQAAVDAFRAGDGGFDVLDFVRGKLSPAQFSTVELAARQAGFIPRHNDPSDPSNATTRVVRAPEPVVHSTTADVVQARVGKELDRRGGADVLSRETHTEVASEQLAKAERELTEGIRRQLRALTPGISAVETERKAREMAAEALQKNERVLKDQQGKLVGLQTLGSQLTARGDSAAGTPSGLRAPVGRFIRDGARAAGSLFTPERGMLGAYGLVTAAPLVGSFVGPDQKETDFVARSGRRTGSYTARSAASGGLEGAAMGAGVGLAFGPWGAALGAGVGAIYGFTSALKQASEALLAARVEADLGALGPRVDSLSKGGSPSDLAEASRLIRQTRGNLDQKATEGAADTFLGIQYGLDAERMVTQARAEVRQAFGPALVSYVQALNEQASSLGKRNPSVEPGQLVEQFKTLNRDLIGVVAAVRGETTSDASRPFEELLKTSQKTGRLQTDTFRAADLAQRAASAFGRLTEAVDRASGGLSRFDQHAAVLTSLLDGSSTQAGVARPESPVTAAALRPQVGAFGGQGGRLLATLAAGEDLARVLPSVLSSVGSTNPADGESFGQKVRSGVKDALGSLNEEQTRGLDLIVNSLNRRDLPEVLRAIQGDVTRLTEELRGTFDGPAREQASRLTEQTATRAAALVDDLNVFAQRQQAVGEQRDVLADLGLAGKRFDAEVAVGRGFAPGTVLSLPELLAPMEARQSRLLSGTGLANTDAEGIAARLAKVDQLVGVATAARDGAAGTAAHLEAAEGLARLTSESAKLQAALKNLADPMSRAAAIQERLAQLDVDRNNRLGYAEKFALSTPADRFRMNREQIQLARVAQNPALAKTLPNLQFQQFLAGANNAPDSVFADGRTGLGVKNAALQARFGIVPQKIEAERADLAARGQGVFGGAAQAQTLLVDRQARLQESFFQTLKGQHDQFFNRLAANLKANDLTDLQVKQGEAGRQLGDLRGKAGAAELLTRSGVSTDDQLARLQARRADVQTYAVSQQNIAKLEAARKAVTQRLGKADGFDGFALAPENTDFSFWASNRRGPEGGQLQRPTVEKASRFLNERFADVLTPEQIGRVMGRFQTEGYESARAAYSTTRNDGGDTNESVAKALRFSLRSAITAELGQEAKKSYDERTRLRQGLEPVGLNLDGFEKALGSTGGAAFLRALEQFGKDNPLSTFNDRLKAATSEFDKLTQSVTQMRAAVEGGRPAGLGAVAGGAAMGFAAGGNVFRPRGTDTVPAMLSPGEFVVRADSARHNSSLLEQINGARGPVYLAGGGFADALYKRRTLEGANRAAAYGYYKRDDVDVLTSRALLRRNARQQVGSLLEQQLFADAGYGDAADRVGVAGAQQQDRFRRDFGGYIGGALRVRTEQRRQSNIERAIRLKQAKDRVRSGSPSWGRSDEGVKPFRPGWSPYWEPTDDERHRLLGMPSGGFSTAGVPSYVNRVRGYAEGGLVKKGVTVVKDNAWYIKEKAKKLGSWLGFAEGGMVSGGVAGRDSVQALLMPGEFVLRKRAVQNLGLANVQGMNRMADGGPVGGSPSGSGGAAFNPEGLMRALAEFAPPAAALASALTLFGSNVDKLVGAMEKFPASVTVEMAPVTHNVVLNGAEVLTGLKEGMTSYVGDLVDRKIGEAFSKRLPEAPSPIQGGRSFN